MAMPPSPVSAQPGPASNSSAPPMQLPVVNLPVQMTADSEEFEMEKPEKISLEDQGEAPYLPPGGGGSPSSTSVSSLMTVSGLGPESY